MLETIKQTQKRMLNKKKEIEILFFIQSCFLRGYQVHVPLGNFCKGMDFFVNKLLDTINTFVKRCSFLISIIIGQIKACRICPLLFKTPFLLSQSEAELY